MTDELCDCCKGNEPQDTKMSVTVDVHLYVNIIISAENKEPLIENKFCTMMS